MQAKSAFWDKKYEEKEKAPKKPRAKTKAPKKNKKKSTASELFTFDVESEVETYSLGSLFIHLINVDYSQDDAKASQACDEEVTIISSDSAPLPR